MQEYQFTPMENLCRLCKLSDWEDPEFKEMQEKVMTAPYLSLRHRKHWEWTIGMLALKKMGKLSKDAIALGVGAGQEWPVFWLTNHIKYVVATDLYTVSQWNEANPSMLIDPGKLSPYSFNKRRLGVMFMNGTELNFEDETFDIVFSYSSIEHFGGKDAAAKAMKEIERVLKPGGIASICTEAYISGNIEESRKKGQSITSEIFTRQEVSEYLLASNGLKLCNEIDYSQQKNEPVIHLPEEVLKVPHIVVEYDGVRLGSVHLTLIK